VFILHFGKTTPVLRQVASLSLHRIQPALLSAYQD
jgi:hypothetical protein